MIEKVIAGNWKMNMDHVEGAELARKLSELIDDKNLKCRVIIFPPFTTIPSVIQTISTNRIEIGAQDLYFEDSGAFTGEVSGKMLKSLGCKYVLVGHSERRHVIGEGAEILRKKLEAALRNGLTPVYCVGEKLDEREAGKAFDVVTRQVLEGIDGLGAEEVKRIIVAYEPVWAIGTGRTATPDDAGKMHSKIREVVTGNVSEDVARSVPILYGGSVKPSNAGELLAVKDVDGVLVGGASLDAEAFFKIIESVH